HELGHFLLAKLFHTRVEKFYIFFNPWFSLFKKKVGETEYGIGWLPLGGYVKISGMIDESMDKEQMKQAPQPHEFRSKPPYQRLLIMIGGVLVNFLLALVIYTFILYLWGEQYLPTKSAKYGISCDSVALDIGLRNGDKILSVDNREIEKFHDIFHDIVVDEARSIQVERNGEKLDIPIRDDHIAPLLKSTYFIRPRFPFIIEGFLKESPAKEAGILPGDRIVGIKGKEVEFFDEFVKELAGLTDERIEISVLRDDKEHVYTLTTTEKATIGVSAMEPGYFFELEKIEYNFMKAIPAGISKGFSRAISYVKQLKLIFTPKTKAYESLGGFIKIGSFFSKVWDWQSFWEMTALLSIMLAIMNLLPIPALDGGHVMFLLYEIVSGRKPGDKFMEYAQITGMVLLLMLLLYANGNDVVQLFRK
ncbi:MAG: RIP metalloprotease RseP, partial [Bacteroidales bacterium]|nr:RIP metalloprotease RseP [Bacteroidales bacterium]